MHVIVTVVADDGRKFTETILDPRTVYVWQPTEPVVDRDGVPYPGFELRPVVPDKA